MIDLSIIIVNYNTGDFIKKCINSILENIPNKIDYEVIVVDNASTDGSLEEVKNDKIKIISNKENIGYSKANNKGIKEAQESRYILFLNPDTVIQKGAIEEMLNFMNTHEDAGASTCKLMMPNGKIDDASHRGFPTPWNAFSHFSGFEKLFPKSKIFSGYSLGWMDLDSMHAIDVLAGAFMLVRRKAGEEARWWDEDYFFYGEDIDFCYMLKEKGWKIYYVPTVSILHYKGISGGIKSVSKEITTASEETKKRTTKCRFEAMRIFYKKHYEKKYNKLVTWLTYKGIGLKENFSSC
jgi:GT2 family glycosyltransferase